MKICKTHPGKEFKLRDGINGPFYSHVVSGDKETGFKYHNSDVDVIGDQIAPETSAAPVASPAVLPEPTRVPLDEPKIEKVDWDAKNRQSMAQTAMKSASEIAAALLSTGLYNKEEDITQMTEKMVKEMANKFFLELIKMKNTST